MPVAIGHKTRSRAQEIVGVLDIGTSKTVCVIATVPGSGHDGGGRRPGIEVLGIGSQPTGGLMAGVVTELDAAEQSVRAAVMQAERMAGVVLEDVSLAVACRGLRSSTFTAGTAVEERSVDEGDIDRLLEAGRTFAERDGRALLHMNCISYRLDDAAEIADPRGLVGSKLAADLHAVTVKEAPLQNLRQVVERAYLSPARLVPAPFASGVAATTEEERHLGVVAIDLGAGMTTVSMFAQGHLLWNDVVPGGGGNITADIARALAVPTSEAERIKRECGTLAKTPDGDDQAPFGAPGEGPLLSHRVELSEVRDVVRGRLVVHLRHVAQRIKASGLAQYAAHWMVLTGGASLQPGLRELAGEVFARPVRLARPTAVPGMPVEFSSPAYAAATGLLLLALDPAAGVRRDRPGARAGGYLGRVGQWLAESF
jgi:cell division protein FtsA